MRLTPEQKEVIKSKIGGVVCQCGNQIVLDRIHEYYLNIIDEIEDARRDKIHKEYRHWCEHSAGNYKDGALDALKTILING